MCILYFYFIFLCQGKNTKGQNYVDIETIQLKMLIWYKRGDQHAYNKRNRHNFMLNALASASFLEEDFLLLTEELPSTTAYQKM